MKLDDTIWGRRSIRRYRREPVPDVVLHEILDLARHAPSSMNGQPWEFIVVKDRAMLAKFGEIKDRFCPPEKKEFKATMFVSAPLAVVVCVNHETSYDRGIENGVLATANLMLAAHSRGLGTVYVSAYRTGDPGVAQAFRDLLRIPDQIDPITIISLGYPDETPSLKTMRPLKVFHEVYEGGETAGDNLPSVNQKTSHN